MKRVVSISIGSSKRNHRVETTILGQDIIIERIGTDGDKEKAIQLIKDMDGEVDAFGLGGIDIYLRCKDKRYIIKDSIPLKQAAVKTPILDGTFLKDTLERRIIRLVDSEGIVNLKEKKVLITSALDRYGMAAAFEEHKSSIIYGDLIFALGIPLRIKSYNTLYNIARAIAPLLLKLPFHMLYPTGKTQDTISTNKFNVFFQEADIIAGDYLYIKKHMPEKMEGKIIITNTITSSDIEDLTKRGVTLLVTTTPEFNGRSFGTNVMEAAIVALSGKNPEDMDYRDFNQMLDELRFRPRVEYLNQNNEVLLNDKHWKGIGGCQGNFIYVLEPYDYKKYLKKGILKYIPDNIFLLFQKRIKPRIVCNFTKDETSIVHGYAAGIFISYKSLSKTEYVSRLIDAVNLVKTEDIKSLIIERINILAQSDIEEIEDKCGVKILDGRNEILVHISYILKETCRLRNQILNEKEILIISDDTPWTEKLAMDIAKESRFLTIMSKDKKFREELGKEILNKTGLSLQLMEKPDRTVQNFDIIINMASNIQLDTKNIKRRTMIIDISLERKLDFLNCMRKDLLIIIDLIFKNSGILKSDSEVFSFKEKVYSYIYEGIKTQENAKPIGIRANGKNYKIDEAVDIYYGRKRNKSLFMVK